MEPEVLTATPPVRPQRPDTYTNTDLLQAAADRARTNHLRTQARQAANYSVGASKVLTAIRQEQPTSTADMLAIAQRVLNELDMAAEAARAASRGECSDTDRADDSANAYAKEVLPDWA